MDEADAGNEMAEKLSEAYLSVRKPEGPVATGFCLSCGEPVDPVRRFCNGSCRDEWAERDQRRRNL